MTASGNRFYAWEIHSQTDMPVEPAPGARDWMDATDQRFAYRCLPMVIANQCGWIVRCPVRVSARWSGGPQRKDLRLRFPRGSRERRVASHFGEGILTFSLPYLFRTPPGIDLWVKGPANSPKDGIQPLEGIVESDWSEATFTMNWKMTRARHTVRFEQGEPICMLVPLQRGLLETLDPIRKPLEDNPDLRERYRKWGAARQEFNDALARRRAAAVKQGWQKDYMQGRDVNGEIVADHQTRLAIREFRRD